MTFKYVHTSTETCTAVLYLLLVHYIFQPGTNKADRVFSTADMIIGCSYNY